MINISSYDYYTRALTYLALRFSGPWQDDGQQEFAICLPPGTARTLFQSTPRSSKSSLNVDRQVFVGRPRRLPLPRGVHDMAWLAGRPGGILSIWPAFRNRISAIGLMLCNRHCPVRLRTSLLVTWSFHVMPKIFRKLSRWKTSSCWHILAALFQVSQANMAVETTREV